jgi:hypothetical protein
MKRVLLLFTFVALVLAGVASADREAGACCPAGEAGKAQMQGHGDTHHTSGTCCGPKAEGQKGCCEGMAEKAHADHAAGCCKKTGENGSTAGCCQKHEGGEAKAGCCMKHEAGERKAGCCMKAGAHGGQS